jgi:DNA-binding transcriptional regulator/RsmH inhibitor MraZ
VVITGMSSYFELWSGQRWRDLQGDLSESASAIAEKLADLGI